MPEQAKPSVGALRAAKRITNLVRLTPVYGRSDNEAMDNTVAEIMESEIGMAELLEAAKTVRVWVALAIGRDPKTTHPKAIEDATKDLVILDSAIAKVERGA